MAGFWLFAHFLPVCFAALFPAADSAMRVPPSHRAAGVFMLIEGGKYTFNFTSARAACLLLNVTIATRDQMEQAVQRGLETCKFGWIAEQIAVVPRITPVQNCGRGQTGLVVWYARTNTMFGVFCFNASDAEGASSTSKAGLQTSTSPASVPASSGAPAASTAPFISVTTAAPSRKPGTTNPPEKTAAFTLPLTTSPSAVTSSTSTSFRSFSTFIPTSLPHSITSIPAVVTYAFSASVSALPLSASSANPSLGVVPTTIIVLAVILLLLTAAGAVWYYQLFPGQQKDDTETEMWKHTDSELDLHSHHGAEEDYEYDESNRKYSSDITLCVNPNIQTNSSE